jgi:hypothetical protein
MVSELELETRQNCFSPGSMLSMAGTKLLEFGTVGEVYPSHFFVLAASNDRALSIMSHSRHVWRPETGRPQSQGQDTGF